MIDTATAVCPHMKYNEMRIKKKKKKATVLKVREIIFKKVPLLEGRHLD